MNFIDLYSLVPINDGLRCLCKDSEGNHYVASKTHHDRNERLLFEDEALANEYAQAHQLSDLRPERLNYNADFLPPSVVWRDKN